MKMCCDMKTENVRNIVFIINELIVMSIKDICIRKMLIIRIHLPIFCNKKCHQLIIVEGIFFIMLIEANCFLAHRYKNLF